MSSKSLFGALNELAEDKEIGTDILIEKIKIAITSTVKKNYASTNDVVFDIDPAKGKFDVYLKKLVIEDPDDIDDEPNQMSLEDAQIINPRITAGEYCLIKLKPEEFGRIVAQHAKNVVKQGVREAEQDLLKQSWGSRSGSIVTANIVYVDAESGNATAEIGGNEITLYSGEMIPGESLRAGDVVRVFVSMSGGGEKRAYFKITRCNEGYLKQLFEIEVPEIADGTVVIKSVARIAGYRSKIAVRSYDENVEAVGACIGDNRRRINSIRRHLANEKIDIILYDDEPENFVKAALSPAVVTFARIDVKRNEKEPVCTVVVAENQLSLAIGSRGQNAKLAARLTGFKIDIKSVGEYNPADFDDCTPYIPPEPEREPEQEYEPEINAETEAAETEAETQIETETAEAVTS